ncbi:hypothetical protein CEUSTIGMA_g724.t1 [Chlamydomonas eustigma]|uniref:Uncharacterized protein n=1 Tax=Chlamydomonas eustigma TaxID=1157962 RepID=A0A250WRV0_9CHLO|nr:hypothetical protein CEUSTIGMA_g724.t1 [Chlamydomonas eustigma]|eukprot:GAX73270.1 hypothetical protein CEUSTIGMA_g724.t1 [Chlamydomonas eustigma]
MNPLVQQLHNQRLHTGAITNEDVSQLFEGVDEGLVRLRRDPDKKQGMRKGSSRSASPKPMPRPINKSTVAVSAGNAGRCEVPGCEKHAKRSQCGNSRYCKAHMKERGMIPCVTQRRCIEEGCQRFAKASTEGTWKYCKAHMRQHGLWPRDYRAKDGGKSSKQNGTPVHEDDCMSDGGSDSGSLQGTSSGATQLPKLESLLWTAQAPYPLWTNAAITPLARSSIPDQPSRFAAAVAMPNNNVFPNDFLLSGSMALMGESQAIVQQMHQHHTSTVSSAAMAASGAPTFSAPSQNVLELNPGVTSAFSGHSHIHSSLSDDLNRAIAGAGAGAASGSAQYPSAFQNSVHTFPSQSTGTRLSPSAYHNNSMPSTAQRPVSHVGLDLSTPSNMRQHVARQYDGVAKQDDAARLFEAWQQQQLQQQQLILDALPASGVGVVGTYDPLSSEVSLRDMGVSGNVLLSSQGRDASRLPIVGIDGKDTSSQFDTRTAWEFLYGAKERSLNQKTDNNDFPDLASALQLQTLTGTGALDLGGGLPERQVGTTFLGNMQQQQQPWLCPPALQTGPSAMSGLCSAGANLLGIDLTQQQFLRQRAGVAATTLNPILSPNMNRTASQASDMLLFNYAPFSILGESSEPLPMAPPMSGRLRSDLELPSMASLLRSGSGLGPAIGNNFFRSKSLDMYDVGRNRSQSMDMPLEATRQRSRSLELRPEGQRNRSRSLDLTMYGTKNMSLDLDLLEWGLISKLDLAPDML